MDLSEPIFEVDGYEEMTENFDATQEFPNENIEKLEVTQYEQNVNKWTQALVRRRLCKLSYKLAIRQKNFAKNNSNFWY